jgi:hypothetical protein
MDGTPGMDMASRLKRIGLISGKLRGNGKSH